MAAGTETTTSLDIEKVPGGAPSFLDAMEQAAVAAAENYQGTPAEVEPPPPESSRPSQLPPEAMPPPPAGLIQAQQEQEQPAPEPPAPAPAPETPPAPPVVEPPPAPGEEPPPANQTAAERTAWKAARENEKQAKQAMRELQETRERLQRMELQRAIDEDQQRRQAQQQYQPDVLEPDPVTQMQAQMAAMQQQMQQQQLENELTMQATAFQAQHPDYNQALNYYVEAEIENAREDGTLMRMAQTIRQNPSYARNVQEIAMRNGITDAEAYERAAMATIYEQRKLALAQGARESGKTVPEIIYQRAKRYGFNAPGQAAAAAAPENIPDSASAAEQVRQEQTQAGSASLSNMPRQTTAPATRPKTHADLLVLAKTDPAALDAHIAAMDRQNPNWMEELG